MASNTETVISSYKEGSNIANQPTVTSQFSMESLQQIRSDISFEPSKVVEIDHQTTGAAIPTISEVVDARCECCGMSEECTLEYVSGVRDRFVGKFMCGLCAEAVNEETEKNGGKREEALNAHVSACVRFNRFGRTYPVLYQAEAMREILKKSCRTRSKSVNPRDKGTEPKKGGIARSSSCISAITKEINGR
ncbi:hypothetical protein SLE2022_036390 [Rubroshorea leprosula]